jgi:hypothetical protein
VRAMPLRHRLLDPFLRSPCRRETVRKTGRGDFAKTLPSSEGDQFIVHIPVQNQRIPSPTVYAYHCTHARRTRCIGRTDSSIPTTLLSIATNLASRSMRQLHPHLLCQAHHACGNFSHSHLRYTLFASHRTSSDFSNSPNPPKLPPAGPTAGLGVCQPTHSLPQPNYPLLSRSVAQAISMAPPIRSHREPTPPTHPDSTRLACYAAISLHALPRSVARIAPSPRHSNASRVVLTTPEELFSKAYPHSTTIWKIEIDLPHPRFLS